MTTAFDPETARPGVPRPGRGGLRAGHRALEPPPGADAAGAIRRNAVGRGASEIARACTAGLPMQSPRRPALVGVYGVGLSRDCAVLNGQPLFALEFCFSPGVTQARLLHDAQPVAAMRRSRVSSRASSTSAKAT